MSGRISAEDRNIHHGTHLADARRQKKGPVFWEFLYFSFLYELDNRSNEGFCLI